MSNMPMPVLIKLLRRYSAPSFDHVNMSAFERDVQGRQHAASIQQCCDLAADRIQAIKLEDLKSRALVAGLKSYGFGDLYERIMREPIDKAIK